jgi:hypothetical protein
MAPVFFDPLCDAGNTVAGVEFLNETINIGKNIF